MHQKRRQILVIRIADPDLEKQGHNATVMHVKIMAEKRDCMRDFL